MTELVDIAFIDDEIIFLKILKAGLKDEIQNNIIEPHFFESSEDFLDYLSEGHKLPRILVIDISMPHMDGFELLEKMKKDNPKLTVYMCSAYDRVDFKEKAEYLGATGFFTKPLRIDALKETIYECAKHKNLQAS